MTMLAIILSFSYAHNFRVIFLKEIKLDAWQVKIIQRRKPDKPILPVYHSIVERQAQVSADLTIRRQRERVGGEQLVQCLMEWE